MKLTKIKLNSYLHFKPNLEIPLTYPDGHPDAGKPLKKVCFLGQSATGKTALLNVIKYFICEGLDFNRTGIEDEAFTEDGVELFYEVDGKTYSKVSAGDKQFKHVSHEVSKSPKTIDDVHDFKQMLRYASRNSSPTLISFPFCVTDPGSSEDAGDLKSLNKLTGELEPATGDTVQVWDFDSNTINSVWKIVFREVVNYRKEYEAKMLDHFEAIKSKTTAAKSVVADFTKWEQSHPNPLQELAEKCLSPMLKHFHLEVETDLRKYDSERELRPGRLPVIIKKNGRAIKHRFLSTGTTQVILTAIPLFYLKPRNSVILFDQPETSLYPNIQCLLPKMYLDCASNNNQFFFATHSPVIASTFDPWEVVELQFQPDGCVGMKNYYRGKRTKDNYFIYPKLLRWDSNYQILFNLQAEGNEDARTPALEELASLEQTIETTKNRKKKRELAQEYIALASKLDWTTDLDAPAEQKL